MRRIGANYIITNTGKAIRNAYLELNDNGVIINLIEHNGELEEVSGLEFYNGVLVPGFVNTHTHLELSYMKDKLKPKKGLPYFISSLREIREQAKQDEIQTAISLADEELKREAVVLVADISNTKDTIETKKSSSLPYKTFIEIFGIDKYQAQSVFENAKELMTEFRENNLDSSITPHATYSVSEKLFSLITELSYQENATLCIHNQETESENLMFINKTGELFDFFSSLGLNLDSFYPTGYNSLPSVIVQLPKCSKLNLVHNTFTTQEDINKVNAYSKHAYWTICPNANLYIEDKLPDINMLYQNNLKICIGTDSLASNTRLSIIEELKTIQKYFPDIPFIDLIKWSSYNGAEALDTLDYLGSFEKGKSPGVALIENFDFENFKLKDDSTVRLLQTSS